MLFLNFSIWKDDVDIRILWANSLTINVVKISVFKFDQNNIFGNEINLMIRKTHIEIYHYLSCNLMAHSKQTLLYIYRFLYSMLWV